MSLVFEKRIGTNPRHFELLAPSFKFDGEFFRLPLPGVSPDLIFGIQWTDAIGSVVFVGGRRGGVGGIWIAACGSAGLVACSKKKEVLHATNV